MKDRLTFGQLSLFSQSIKTGQREELEGKAQTVPAEGILELLSKQVTRTDTTLGLLVHLKRINHLEIIAFYYQSFHYGIEIFVTSGNGIYSFGIKGKKSGRNCKKKSINDGTRVAREQSHVEN